jgi:hypothetical protein
MFCCVSIPVITCQVSLKHDTNHGLGSHLSGVMVCMLAIGPKVRGFKPGRGDGF